MRLFIPMNKGRVLIGPFPTERAARKWWRDHEVKCAGGIEREHWPDDKFPGAREATAEELKQMQPPEYGAIYWTLTHT